VIRRGASDVTRAPGVVTTGCLAIVAEFVLMGYPVTFVEQALNRIRQADLSWVRRTARGWLQLLGPTPSAERVQTEYRALALEQGVFFD
jgi:hypothetical protein